ncbi:MAG: ribonuclease HII [Candidatus Omnitrophota bacterium]|nr:ribonuclease HII [Candidatus Omnitrophota bacterium]
MPNFSYESAVLKKGFECVGGVDEAGRGPLAGPVVAAAVVLKKIKFKNRIDDSKLLSASQREKAYYEITQNSFFGTGIICEKIIDTLNILRATRLAMENAIYSCVHKIKGVERLSFLIDGTNIALDIPYKFQCIIGGDSKSLSIACASIIAKVTRDRIMQIYDKVYPEYGFKQHKGYGTREHILNLKKAGVSAIHRRSFYPVSLMCNA